MYIIPVVIPMFPILMFLSLCIHKWIIEYYFLSFAAPHINLDYDP